MERIERYNDPVAMTQLGCYYKCGDAGFSLDNAKAVELRNNDETDDNGTSLVELHLNKWAKDHVSEGDIIGVRSAEDYNLSGLYKIDSLNLEVIKIQVPTSNDIIPFTQQEFILTKLRKVRVDLLCSRA